MRDASGLWSSNHCLFMVDFQEASLVGEAPHHIKRFTSQCLITKVSSGATQRYLHRLEANLDCHRLIERLGELHTTCTSKQAF
jgi:hypothetical protein